MSKDKSERRHRRTTKSQAAQGIMAGANFAGVESLSQAMGIGPDIEGLSVSLVRVQAVSNQTVQVDLDDISGDDFVACCSEDLLAEIVSAAGAHFNGDDA